jgi:hypothetical protein
MPATVSFDVATTQQRIRVNKGEDFTLTLPVLDSMNRVVPLATSWSALVQVHAEGNGHLLYEWSSTAGNLTCTTAGVELQFISSVTELWQWNDGRFECEVTSPTGKRGIVSRGTFTALDRQNTP